MGKLQKNHIVEVRELTVNNKNPRHLVVIVLVRLSFLRHKQGIWKCDNVLIKSYTKTSIKEINKTQV